MTSCLLARNAGVDTGGDLLHSVRIHVLYFNPADSWLKSILGVDELGRASLSLKHGPAPPLVFLFIAPILPGMIVDSPFWRFGEEGLMYSICVS